MRFFFVKKISSGCSLAVILIIQLIGLQVQEALGSEKCTKPGNYDAQKKYSRKQANQQGCVFEQFQLWETPVHVIKNGSHSSKC